MKLESDHFSGCFSVVNETTTTATLKVANKELTAKDFTVLVNGKEVTPTKVESDAKGEVYTITHASLKDTSGTVSVNGKQAAFNFVVVEPKVESVKAINAKQVEVKFATAVDEASVLETAGTLKAGVFVFKSLETPVKTITANSATGVLSEDGKTLTVKASGTEVFEGRYDVTVDGAKDKAGKVIDKYVAKNVDFGKDTVAPTITATERISSNQVKVKFSEPVVFAAGALTAKYTDTSLTLDNSKITVGSTALGSVTSAASAPVSELVLNLSNADVKVDKDIAVKFNGVADTDGNLISPQPAEITVVKQQADGVEPTISTVTQTGAKKFAIKFAKDLDGNIAAADVTVGGVATTAVKKVSASEYEFTTATNLKGLQTVEVAANKAVDLAGQKNTAALSKLVTFTEDATAPKATSKLVVGKDNKEYIELTFDKDVTAGAVTVAGSRVKDYITTSGISESVTAVYADGTGVNKKVLHVPLTAASLAVEGAAYDLTVSSAAVTSIAGVKMTDTTAKFTRGTDGASANTDIVSAVVVAQGGDNNTVTATFTIPSGSKLDGTTATNVANYVIAGAEVESVSLAAASGTTQVATLKLKEGSNTFTGVRNITVKDVKVAGSTKVMEPKTSTTVSLKENVRPTVTKSEVTKVTQSTTGSALVPAVNATVSNAQLVTTGVATGTPVVTLNSATYNTGASKAAVNGVELEYDGAVWKSNTAAVADSAITSVSGVTGAVAGDKVTFDLSAYTAEVPAVPATTGSTDVLLTFSEAVVPGSAVDFELFIDNSKVTATVATSAVTDTKTLKVTIDKALTTENFAKGVQLKAATTLDIADTAGNLLKLDAPISLKLN
ncbi:hypothetical protein [Sporosarcina sp. SAFN-010]|uniref:hypothetical protein n=1 Tax=Sporosarcina sp. SAFN-010 TaxID=3387273 RepID=UPI003F7E5178